MSDHYITKGSKIRARWFSAPNMASLSGMQMKFSATEIHVEGIIRHFRSSSDTDPRPDNTMVYIDPTSPDSDSIEKTRPIGCKCPNGHVAIRCSHIYSVEDPE